MRRLDWDVRVARYLAFFGEEMKRFFIYDLIQKINSSDKEVELNVVNGLQIRDYLHVEDVASDLFLLLKRVNLVKFIFQVESQQVVNSW